MHAQVLILIEDANVNPPNFTSDVYTASVPENAEVDTLVLVVQATDSDEVCNAHAQVCRNKICEENCYQYFFPMYLFRLIQPSICVNDRDFGWFILYGHAVSECDNINQLFNINYI